MIKIYIKFILLGYLSTNIIPILYVGEDDSYTSYSLWLQNQVNVTISKEY